MHPAALIRCVGTHNKKNGGNGLCRPLWNGGGPLDVTELEELDDLLAEPLLTRKPKPAGEPHAGIGEHKGPVDVEAEFASMHDGASTNAAQTRIIPSLLRKGEHPDDVLELVVDRTMAQVGVRLGWTREAESKAVVKRILSRYSNLLMKDYDPTTGVIPSWLPGAFHEIWIAKLQAGQCPTFGFNGARFLCTEASRPRPAAKPQDARHSRRARPAAAGKRAHPRHPPAVCPGRPGIAAAAAMALRPALPAARRKRDDCSRRYRQDIPGDGGGSRSRYLPQPARRAAGGALPRVAAQRRRQSRGAQPAHRAQSASTTRSRRKNCRTGCF